MAIRKMECKASDHKYLHRDFHVSADLGLSYLGERYGDEGVRDYLTAYARHYLAPLIRQIRERGLPALEEYIAGLYEAEEAPEVLHLERSEGCLTAVVDRCPAVSFMRGAGHAPSRWYPETVRTVFGTVAADSGLSFDLLYYHPEDGSCSYRFRQPQ